MNVAIGPYQAVIPDYVALVQRGRASSWMSAYQSLGNAAGLVIAALVKPPAIIVAIAAPLAIAWLVTITYLRGRSGNPVEPAQRALVDRAAVRVLVVLLLSRGLINVGFFTLLGFLLFFVRESLGIKGDATVTQTGYLFLTFTLFGVVGALAAARPSDRTDKRRVVSLACAVIALALAVLAAAGSLAVALPAAALAGAAWGAFVTADWALASALLPPGAMATAMGLWNVATTVPQVIAPLLTGLLVVSRLDAIAPGAGPRGAIVLALLEFLAGGALIWRLPRA